MTKKLLLLFVCSMTAVCSFGQKTWYCGTNGSNVTATLSNGILTFSGTGEMQNFYNLMPPG